MDWLRRHAEAFPNATRKERARDWEEEPGSMIEASTIGRGLRQIGWSYKKTTPTARERNREDVVAKRASFLDRQPSLDVR
ncbi:MAG: hypothetical protein GY822_27235 [Deltaproteobacteria bacterium]|nr:hypothetical protein [Deltaproteobacteria bacterium]